MSEFGIDVETLTVADKTDVAEGVVTLTLVRPQGLRLADRLPGAHIDLNLPNGLTRQYSMCGDRFDAHSYRIGILREPAGRGGSADVHGELQVGDRIGIGGPRNNFPLVPSQRHWAEPDVFDLARGPSGHVGFGMGIHQCVGQHVARLEAEALLTALAARRGNRGRRSDYGPPQQHPPCVGLPACPRAGGGMTRRGDVPRCPAAARTSQEWENVSGAGGRI